jgi:hypothetical protein
MWGFRSSNRARSAAEAATPVVDEVVETPPVPCNNLRAHGEIGADGKLEMRWDLASPGPVAVTPMRLRPYLPRHPSTRSA